MVDDGAGGVVGQRPPGADAASRHVSPRARSWWPGAVAIVTGGASALLSLYWTVGGTALLDTVGGYAERLADAGGARALLVGVAVVAAKVTLVAVAAVLASGGGSSSVRRLGLVAGALLTVYGAGLTAVGLLALAGVFGTVADPHALAWHALLWDPWFILWGVALWLTSRQTGIAHPRGLPYGAGRRVHSTVPRDRPVQPSRRRRRHPQVRRPRGGGHG
jgi:hypothetical protein